VQRAPGFPCALSLGRKIYQNLGRVARRELNACLEAVIASEAKQSISPRKERMDCFASLAMTLLGSLKKDCFAEPVIGRRFAPTRWLAMTA
jgi:hypothetical protein